MRLSIPVKDEGGRLSHRFQSTLGRFPERTPNTLLLQRQINAA